MPPRSVTASRPDGGRARSVTSLWRLRGYLRPYAGSLAVMATAAITGVFVSISIPLVTKAIIDGPLAERDEAGIWPLGLLALLLGIVEAGLILLRRWIQARAVLGV